MSSVQESPAKRRKLADQPIDLTSEGESDSYSPPNMVPDYDTVATVPLHPPGSQHYTQPTQIIDRNVVQESPSTTRRGIVQVAASSPAPSPVKKMGGSLSSAMAPAGTSFCIPKGVITGPSQPIAPVIDLSDDDAGPRYMGGSSDEGESQLGRKTDIKPARFVRREEERVVESPQAKQPVKDLKSITATAYYSPIDAGRQQGMKGSVYDPRNRNSSSTSTVVTGGSSIKTTPVNKSGADGLIRKPPPKFVRQSQPARALSVQQSQHDMSLSEIDDPQQRRKVERMRTILQKNSIRECHQALLAKRGNADDAMDYLSELSERQDSSHTPATRKLVDLTSEDELLPTPAAPKMKQETKAPAKSMWQKYGGSTQNAKLTSSLGTSDTDKLVPKISGQPTKRIRKLVRGPRPGSSPPLISRPKPQPEVRKLAKVVDSSDSDEAADAGSASEDESLEARLLQYFNKCSPGDLADLAGTPIETATYLLSKRPFKSLKAIREIPAESTKPSKSKIQAKAIGNKIVDKCADMLSGYEAVDSLVKECEQAGKPLASEMRTWGIDIFGAKEGELDISSLKESQANHDSGIGTPVSELSDGTPEKRRRSNFISQPGTMDSDRPMKDYQVVGINWLNLLFKNNLSGILADDMGLGKTCQVIGFLAHLAEVGERGPHLVVVPASTLENWVNEFASFCPSLTVRPLYAPQAERRTIRDKIDRDRANINVVITTYAIARANEDFPWLRKFEFCCSVFDEGHSLKNSTSKVYKDLIRVRSRFRLLLTGTPLQNNLQELISLLAFLMPEIFKEKKDELQVIFDHKVKTKDANHEALLSAERISRARSMLTPFILRRKKHQVLKELPKKISRVELCAMTEEQKGIYEEQQERARDVMHRRAEGEQMSAQDSANILMKLRQAAIHPFLFRRLYSEATLRRISKACLKDEQWAQSNPKLIYQELLAYSDMEIHQLCSRSTALQKFTLRDNEWMSSGKISKLVDLVTQFVAQDHRILIFSQFVMVMDILELVLQTLHMEFFRLDGATKVDQRQDMINAFCNAECTAKIFMLSTKAGGAGINLARANKVIIFDSGFNPQDDIQAENRAHRIGQVREVEVVRLVSSDTIEEQIHLMGLMKLKLDQRVAGEAEAEEAVEAEIEAGKGKTKGKNSKERSEEEGGGGEEDEKDDKEVEGQNMVERLLFKKLQGVETGGSTAAGFDVDAEVEVEVDVGMT